MIEMIRELHEARVKAAELKAAWHEITNAFECEHAAEIDAIGAAAARVSDLEYQIKTATVTTYLRDRSAKDAKKPYPGCGVRVVKRYNYEPTEALNWAKEHSMCLALDSKKFTELCRGSARPDFVAEEEDVTATIAPDLGAVLEG